MKSLSIGPPPVPLPDRWWRACVNKRSGRLNRHQIRRVIHIEMHGSPSIVNDRHRKGYVEIYLVRGHPYGNKTGTTRLHRWLKCRELGRKLAAFEHVHHDDDCPKDEIDTSKLKVLEEYEHGQYHRIKGRVHHVSCGPECPHDEIERMAADLPTAAEQEIDNE